MTSTSQDQFYNDLELKQLANYLRSTNGVKIRSAIEHEKRVDYFKGSRLIDCLLEAKAWPKKLAKIEDKGTALQVAQQLLKSNFFHRSEKIEGKKGYLRSVQRNVFEENAYFTWMFMGDMVWSNIATFGVIAVVIIFTLLPVWPAFAKKILWYLSVTFLLVTFVFLMIRLLCFVVMWICGYEFWIFPRLFDESLSVTDSFKPVIQFDKGTAGQGFYRIGMLLAIVGFCFWAYSQPTDFDNLIQAQKEFVDDLYSGKLLADAPHNIKENMERQRNRVPNLDDLLRQVELDNLEGSKEEGYEGDDYEGTRAGGDDVDDHSQHDEQEEDASKSMEDLLMEEVLRDREEDDDNDVDEQDAAKDEL